MKENDLNKLNDLCVNILKDLDFNLEPYYYVLSNNKTSVTVVPDEDCFILNPPILGKIKSFNDTSEPTHVVKEKGLIAIHRNIIGFAMSDRMLSNRAQLYMTLMNLINFALLELKQTLGTLTNYKIKVGFPDEDIFKLTDNFAGVEFNVSVIKE